MHTKEFIEKWLMDNATVATADGCADGTGMTRLHQKVFGHGKNVIKADAARDLAEFYADPQNILDIWNGDNDSFISMDGLNESEKTFISIIVQYGGREFKPTSKKLADELGLAFKKEERRYSWGSSDPFDGHYNYGRFYLAFLHLLKQNYPNTRVPLFFPGGKAMPPFVLDVLKPVIPPFQYKYSEYEPDEEDYVICREDRLADFAAVVRFAGSEELKVKQYSYDLTKAKLAKMAAQIGFPEVCDGDGEFCTPKESRRSNDFKVALPLFALSANSGLVEINKKWEVKPSKNAVELLSKPSHEFAKQLFNDYIAKNNIYETHYITYISVRDGEHWLKWEECRKPIIEQLKKCPVGAWVDFYEFEKYVSIFCGDFFRKLLNCAVFVQGFNFGYGYYGSYEPDWDECDAQIIRMILTFLSTMGVVDVAYSQSIPRIKSGGDDFCVGITGFRITPLGAWILGLSGKYEGAVSQTLQSADGGLIVQPDHTVIISGMNARIEHEPYLSAFLTKSSVDENAAIYKIDFASMVRAFNRRIMPEAVIDYLKKASKKPIPDNVGRSFEGWQAKVGRVRIRTVTVLETNDNLLLQELIHTKGVEKYIGTEIKNAAVISNENDAGRVKAAVEKNGWFVLE